MIDVLLIEDDASAGYALAALLTFNGYRIVLAANGEDALPLMARSPLVAIVDLMLPDHPGEWVLDTLRDRCPGASPIVWTALVDGDRLDAVRARGVQVVRKPLAELDDLIRLLPPPRSTEGGGP